MTTHQHSFICPETDHGDYHGRQADTTPAGMREAARRELLVRRFPAHPIARYVGSHAMDRKQVAA